jgi:RHS repeat-associated protein
LTATGNTLYYLHSDHLGSTSLTTDSGGNVTARQNYYPYGAIRSGGGMPTDIAFTGQRADSYIKLYQMGARWYDPEIGRWISPDTIVPDPSSPQQFNRFGYVSNNPVKYTDPTGHDRDCGLMDRSCDDLRDEYRNSDWQKHLGFKQFVAAKDAYAYYMSNPEAAFQEGWVEDVDSYMWARIYSEDVRHEWFNPLNDNFLAGKMQEAREHGDVDQWYMIAVAFGVSEWLSYSFGGGNPGGLPHPRLPKYTGGKTTGILDTGAGEIDLVSGYSGPSASLPKGTRGFNRFVKSHVEAHAAATMRQQGLQKATLYINKIPCSYQGGCQNMLPHMLPPGAELTIYGPNGWQAVYTGLP